MKWRRESGKLKIFKVKHLSGYFDENGEMIFELGERFGTENGGRRFDYNWSICEAQRKRYWWFLINSFQFYKLILRAIFHPSKKAMFIWKTSPCQSLISVFFYPYLYIFCLFVSPRVMEHSLKTFFKTSTSVLGYIV